MGVGKLPGPIFRSGIYPDADPGEHPWNRQGIFNKMHRNKQSLCIDLKTTPGREVFVDLVRISDIVLDNYSPRGVASLGLDYEQLSKYNPRIITVSMSGYGLTGPDSMRVSLGPVLEAHSGLASATGYEDGGPLKMGVAFADPIAALHALAATLAALDQRDRTGVGMGLDFSSSRPTRAWAASSTSRPRSPGRRPAGTATVPPTPPPKACTSVPARTPGWP